jgi:hypothetical protein
LENKQVADEAALLDKKVDELVALLQKGVHDKERLNAVRHKINHALDEGSLPKTIEAFKEIDTGKDRLDVLNNFEFLLTNHQLDSKASKKYILRERLKKILVMIIGIIMITLGMAMIIMPAPPYFEMFTIFHFNQNDGVTIMDLISLLIVFTGVYLLLSTLLKKQRA